MERQGLKDEAKYRVIVTKWGLARKWMCGEGVRDLLAHGVKDGQRETRRGRIVRHVVTQNDDDISIGHRGRCGVQ